MQRLIWSDSTAIQSRAEVLAHDARSAELLDRLARGEKALKLSIKKARQFRLQRLAESLRETANALDKASRRR